MIEAFRDDELINKFGGRFKLCVLIQQRWRQLLQGARPMVETKGLTDMEIVVREILDGKLDMTMVEKGAADDGGVEEL